MFFEYFFNDWGVGQRHMSFAYFLDYVVNLSDGLLEPPDAVVVGFMEVRLSAIKELDEGKGS